MPCALRSLMVASTKRWATSREASISTLVAVRVLRIEMPPATKRGKKIDRCHGEEKLSSDGPVIPKLLQHDVKVSRAPKPPHDHARRWHTLMHARSSFS